MAKLLRINLDSKKYALEEMPAIYANLGGRGLTSKIVSEEVPPKADPLGAENKLVIAAGILARTPAPNNSRLSVGTKSPLTGTIKEANSGGAAAQKLARLGIQGVVVDGVGKDLVMAKITKDGVKFIAAKKFEGMGNYALIDKLKAEHGDEVAIISIGPWARSFSRLASVAVTSPDFKIRMASPRRSRGRYGFKEAESNYCGRRRSAPEWRQRMRQNSRGLQLTSQRVFSLIPSWRD